MTEDPPIISVRERRRAILEKFEIPLTRRRLFYMRVSFMDQLDQCKDDAARRLLLGVSR